MYININESVLDKVIKKNQYRNKKVNSASSANIINTTRVNLTPRVVSKKNVTGSLENIIIKLKERGFSFSSTW